MVRLWCGDDGVDGSDFWVFGVEQVRLLVRGEVSVSLALLFGGVGTISWRCVRGGLGG